MSESNFNMFEEQDHDVKEDLAHMSKVFTNYGKDIEYLIEHGDIWIEGGGGVLVADTTTGNANKACVYAFAKAFGLQIRFV